MTVWTVKNTKFGYMAGIYTTKEKAEKAIVEAVANGAVEKDYFIGIHHLDHDLVWI